VVQVHPVLWCLVLASGCLIAARRLFQHRIARAIEHPQKYWLLAIDVAVGALYVFVIHSWDNSLNPPPNYDECAVDRLYGLGCIHGTIVDESGKAISHIEVDLIPVHKTGDARWYGTHSEWTDDQGRYNLNRIEPGEYLLGANAFSSFGAPDAERPFATAYYPAAETESDAAVAKVFRSSPLRLPPLRLRKLEVVTIKINVLWADGTRPNEATFTSRIFFIHDMEGPRHRSTTAQENSHFQKILNMMPWLRSNVMQVRLSNHMSPVPARPTNQSRRRSNSSRDDFYHSWTTMPALGQPLMNFGLASRQPNVEVATGDRLG